MKSRQALATAARVVFNHRGDRRVILRRAMFRTLRRLTPVVAVDRDGVRVFVNTADDTGSWVYAFDELLDERHLAAGVRHARRFYRAPSPDSSTFLDVGANIGTTCIPAVLRHGFAQAIAIEPAPASVALLRQNLIANGVVDRVRIVEAAATAEPGAVEVELSPRNSADHRVRLGAPAPGLFGEDQWPTTTVPGRTLDEILAAESVPPDRIGMAWMDIQGFEVHALRGATSLLGSPVPLVVEYWPYGLRRAGTLEQLWQLAAEHFEGFVDIRTAAPDDPPRPIAELAGLEVAGPDGFTDLLLVK